jgi:hypothetical protein
MSIDYQNIKRIIADCVRFELNKFVLKDNVMPFHTRLLGKRPLGIVFFYAIIANNLWYKYF